MATPHTIERAQSPGRRAVDLEKEQCAVHEQDIDAINKELAKQAGWFKASAGFLSIAVMVLGWFGTLIISNLSDIKQLLNRTDVVIERHTQQIDSLKNRIEIIEDRHKWEDQNHREVHK